MNTEKVAKIIVFTGVSIIYLLTIHQLLIKVTNNVVAFLSSIVILCYIARELIGIEL